MSKKVKKPPKLPKPKKIEVYSLHGIREYIYDVHHVDIYDFNGRFDKRMDEYYSALVNQYGLRDRLEDDRIANFILVDEIFNTLAPPLLSFDVWLKKYCSLGPIITLSPDDTINLEHGDVWGADIALLLFELFDTQELVIDLHG